MSIQADYVWVAGRRQASGTYTLSVARTLTLPAPDVPFPVAPDLGGQYALNYGSYTTNEASAAYGRPSQNTAVEYQPRMMQLGFRFVF
jgi:hypothetical protein